MTFWGGSGSGDPWIRIRILDPDPAIFVIDLPAASKKVIFNTFFSAYYFLKVHLHHFSKIKSQKESHNSRNQAFSNYFCMMIKGSGSIPLTSGSGSWRPKNMWIRWIRIRNTDFNADATRQLKGGKIKECTYDRVWPLPDQPAKVSAPDWSLVPGGSCAYPASGSAPRLSAPCTCPPPNKYITEVRLLFIGLSSSASAS
jgi:hypothetical protein